MTAPALPRISDYARWHADRTPDAVALRLAGAATTYKELADAIDAQARALLAAGVRKGDRVASLQTPHPQYLIDLLATASIGGIWVGLNPRYQLEELRHVIVDCEPSVLIARAHIGERDYGDDIVALRQASESLKHVVIVEDDHDMLQAETLSTFLAHGEGYEAALLEARAKCGGRDPCLIVYTSGSTGAPKGALLHHEGLAAFALGQNRLWPIDPLRIINYFPINHVGCVADCTLPCLTAGGELNFMEKFDPIACLETMARERVTMWGSVPSTFQMMLDTPNFSKYDLSAVQIIVWGGAPMPEELILRLKQICPRMGTNYGMTETTSAITALEPTSDIDALAHSVGHAFSGVEVRLRGLDESDVPNGETGEVQARSRLNFLGYWRKPEATQQAFTEDGYFRTGDLAVRRDDGRYRIVGRLKEMYKSGGYNVYPREIEAVLETHPLVAAAAVVPAPDPLWQEVGIAYVSLH
ncbi:MAG TPA: AMP-binding protein, partial [Verrucomicrobiae bacterium]|nr:AMP-binding protein [Verrucomicrobiae bacterium]